MESPAPPTRSLVEQSATFDEDENDRRFKRAKAIIDQPVPTPASSLVERVARAIANAGWDTDSYDPEARAAIRRVAAAARAQDSKHCDLSGVAQLVTWEMVAQWLEKEASR